MRHICFASNKRISDFEGGVATLSVPFTVPKGMRADKFTVWYVADDGRLEELETWYEDGKLCWSVDHFSDFIITYDGEEHGTTPTDPVSPPTRDNTILWSWILLVIAALCTIFFLVYWKRRRTTNA